MLDEGTIVQADAVSHLWQEWQNRGDSGVREQLLTHYQRFARIMAAKLYGQHPYKVLEFDDYLQYAYVGLMESLERFDPTSGVLFETYSASRIRGAILDGVRRSSDIQEQVSARRRLTAERLVSLNDDPVPAGMEELFKRLAGMAIGMAIGLALDGTGMFQDDEAGSGENVYHGVEVAQLGRHLRALVNGLPSAQRTVIVRHYLQQQSFAAIADHMQVTRGRISQLHKEALSNLRSALQRRGISDFSC